LNETLESIGVKLADKPEKLNDRYTLWEKIASGGMADVYRATEYGAKGSSKTVALKKILSNFSNTPEYRKMFIDEGIIGSQLTHANICQVNPLIEIEDNLYIPMEFIEGKNLRQVINKYKKKNGLKPLPVPFSLFVINEVYKGLEYAHTKIGDDTGKPLNIVHRDMSPQNIMLSYQGGVKLIDFGIAKSKILTNETRAGVIKGKYSYMSPEQASGLPLGPQSDIFSTAIVLWELLTGERLFQSENDMATLKSIQECDLKNQEPIKKNPEVTQELNRIVMKALTKDLSLRYKSADLIQQHIQKYINEKYSSYSARDIRKFLEGLFSEDIILEQKKAKELYSATLSNSQQKSRIDNREIRQLEKVLDESATKTDMSDSGGVTRTDQSYAEDSPQVINEFELEEPAEEFSSNESSQKTEVSFEQSNISMPTMFGNEEKRDIRPENSVTRAGGPAETEIGISNLASSKARENDATDNSELSRTKSPGTDSQVKKQNWGSFDLQLEKTPEKTGSGKNSFSERDEVRLDSSPNEESRSGVGYPGSLYEPQQKNNQKWIALGAIGAFVITGYLYRLIFTGNINKVFDVVTNRTTANSNVTVNSTIPVESATKAEIQQYSCQIKVDTDPPGATIIGDNFNGTSSTGAIAVPCGQAIVLRLEKPGYETYKISADTTNKVRQTLPLVTLQVRREGSIILTVDQNSKVEVDGKLYGEAKANVPTEFHVTPGKHKFIFRNEVLGLFAEQSFQILDQEKRTEPNTIKLIDVKPAEKK